MDFTISMEQRIADFFDEVLTSSVEMGKERFGVCQFSLTDMAILDVVPPSYFEEQGLILQQDLTSITPNPYVMQQMQSFNQEHTRQLAFLDIKKDDEPRYIFHRDDGIALPFHTHPDPDDDMCSSKGREDTHNNFVIYKMPIDLVISSGARERGIEPPVCATFNPDVFAFDESMITRVYLHPKAICKRDRSLGLEPDTGMFLLWQQKFNQRYISIDFDVYRQEQHRKQE